MIRVLVVDDHKLVRIGTSRLLADIDRISVVGQASTGEEAIDMVKDLKPDVVLMDIQMPGIGGMEATKRCLRIDPELKVIVVTVHEEDPYPSQLMSVGAAGYLTKKSDVNEMVRSAGQRYISSEIAQQLALKPFSQTNISPFEQLSEREMQITLMVIEGYKVLDISENLALSPKTVNSYRYRIFEKLAIANDVCLTKLAIKHRIIDAETPA